MWCLHFHRVKFGLISGLVSVFPRHCFPTFSGFRAIFNSVFFISSGLRGMFALRVLMEQYREGQELYCILIEW